jgi:hypothetical protein
MDEKHTVGEERIGGKYVGLVKLKLVSWLL